MVAEPTTLQEALVYFADPQNCRDYVVPHRWSNGVVLCPTCGSDRVKFQPQHNRWQCTNKHPRRQFTLKTGTVMEDSPIGLDKWLTAMWLVSSNRNGVSSLELHRALGITQKTAWFLLHRIRLATQDDLSGGSLAGEVEIDETFIGGKSRNMHKSKKVRLNAANNGRGLTGGVGKAVVLGILERGGKVRASVIPDRSKASIQPIIRGNVDRVPRSCPTNGPKNTAWMTSTNTRSSTTLRSMLMATSTPMGMENFWSLLKRTIGRTYVSVEPFHLFRYVDEQAFRFNNRLPMKDADRFSYLVRKIVGKRLTYAELTGKVEERPEDAIPFYEPSARTEEVRWWALWLIIAIFLTPVFIEE